jgi:hypothetical protein
MGCGRRSSPAAALCPQQLNIEVMHCRVRYRLGIPCMAYLINLFGYVKSSFRRTYERFLERQLSLRQKPADIYI